VKHFLAVLKNTMRQRAMPLKPFTTCVQGLTLIMSWKLNGDFGPLYAGYQLSYIPNKKMKVQFTLPNR